MLTHTESASRSSRTGSISPCRSVTTAAALILHCIGKALVFLVCTNVPRSWMARSLSSRTLARVRWFRQPCPYLQTGWKNMPDDLDAPRIIRVLLADDHDILRQGLKLLLGLQQDICIVGEARTGR